MTATAAHDNGAGGGCVFCAIAASLAPAQIVARWPDALAIVPLNPVTDGHLLVLPTSHTPDAAYDPDVTAATMRRAAELAQGAGPANLITSIGPEATQTVAHLHIHLVPRRTHDGLHLPWTVPTPVAAEAQTTSDDPTGAWL
ncbi:HIT family protein [Kitasatospora sp. NPDC056800]|uniref:HIT family protein n=1 Tax=Kitasatospora sp. NPDC056800 TaxID=3345948 RepID=UPI0036AE4D60